jgi:hypothetical protein
MEKTYWTIEKQKLKKIEPNVSDGRKNEGNDKTNQQKEIEVEI